MVTREISLIVFSTPRVVDLKWRKFRLFRKASSKVELSLNNQLLFFMLFDMVYFGILIPFYLPNHQVWNGFVGEAQKVSLLGLELEINY